MIYTILLSEPNPRLVLEALSENLMQAFVSDHSNEISKQCFHALFMVLYSKYVDNTLLPHKCETMHSYVAIAQDFPWYLLFCCTRPRQVCRWTLSTDTLLGGFPSLYPVLSDLNIPSPITFPKDTPYPTQKHLVRP